MNWFPFQALKQKELISLARRIAVKIANSFSMRDFLRIARSVKTFLQMTRIQSSNTFLIIST